MAKDQAPAEGETLELDPEFEAALTAALALDATERLEKLTQLADDLTQELN
ncbi:GTPase [Rothia nasimurium]|uniref:GTPase n=1 Tax=Rothia nasimurium TaxID=85336 RepID=UPI001F296FCE|nr:GTPase [Rothia nasimurium]